MPEEEKEKKWFSDCCLYLFKRCYEDFAELGYSEECYLSRCPFKGDPPDWPIIAGHNGWVCAFCGAPAVFDEKGQYIPCPHDVPCGVCENQNMCDREKKTNAIESEECDDFIDGE